MSAETASTKKKRARVAWIAGMRGEFMLLGAAFLAMRQRHNEPCEPMNWLLASGEHGMAGYQAMDALGLVPDESSPLCHPADDLAVRLNVMLERVEAFGRHHKVSHVIFTGYGPAAAASAMYCHSRGCPGLWLRPPDTAGLIPRMRWESGLERIIRACEPSVTVQDVSRMPRLAMDVPDVADPVAEIDGLRPDAPLALIAVERRNWGMLDDSTQRLVRFLGRQAAARPETDWLVVTNLNARLEGPLRSFTDRPPNLLQSPPLQPDLYHGLLARASVLLTDSPMIASEGMAGGRLVAALADEPAEMAEINEVHLLPVTIGDLDDGAREAILSEALMAPMNGVGPFDIALDPRAENDILTSIRQWLTTTG